MHAKAMTWLKPKLGQLTRQDAATALTSEWMAELDDLARGLATLTAPAFDRMAANVAKKNASALSDLGLDVRGQLGPHLAQMREWNQRLMVQTGRSYATDVAEVLDDPSSWGLTLEALTARIQERATVSESRAELIARDQTAKTVGSISKFRQQSVGVKSYVWSGSLDERERETHLANEGKTFDWDDPPAETGHPTEDVNCRCVAVPVLPGEEEDTPEPDDAPPDAPDAPEAAPATAPTLPAPPSFLPLEEGTHAGDIVVRRSVDQELADEALAQPPEVLEHLARNPVDEVEFFKRSDLDRDPPGSYERRQTQGGEQVSNRIRINAHMQGLDEWRRQPNWTVSSRVSVRAAARASTPIEQEQAARRMHIKATTTHEIGHHVHLGQTPNAQGVRLPSAVDHEVDKVVSDTYRAARRDASWKNLSEYSGLTRYEYFAESYSAYHHAPKLLDSKARDMVEKVLTLRKGTP